jgi:hypothetical protein
MACASSPASLHVLCPSCRKRSAPNAGQLVFLCGTCPICLEESSPVVALPCGHVVCKEDFERIGGKFTCGEHSKKRRENTALQTRRPSSANRDSAQQHPRTAQLVPTSSHQLASTSSTPAQARAHLPEGVPESLRAATPTQPRREPTGAWVLCNVEGGNESDIGSKCRLWYSDQAGETNALECSASAKIVSDGLGGTWILSNPDSAPAGNTKWRLVHAGEYSTSVQAVCTRPSSITDD